MEIDFTKEDILKYWKNIDDYMLENEIGADYPQIEIEIIHKFIVQTLEEPQRNG